MYLSPTFRFTNVGFWKKIKNQELGDCWWRDFVSVPGVCLFCPTSPFSCLESMYVVDCDGRGVSLEGGGRGTYRLDLVGGGARGVCGVGV